jgi:hypothetical protein
MRPFRALRTLAAGALTAGVAAAPARADVTLALTHVTVVDVRGGGVKRDVTLLIDGGTISAIVKGKTKSPAGATVLDARGKFVIPGLWDMHYHFDDSRPGPREYDMLVANGVLGIRDMGDKPETIFPAREETASGRVLGPRIVACGPIIDGPSPANPPLSVAVTGPEDGREAVEKIKAMGADCIKVHDGVPREAYLAIADEARRAGLPLVGHVPVRVRVREATNAGQRTIEHQLGLRGLSTVEDEIMERERTHDVFAEAMKSGNFALIPENIAEKGNDVLDHLDDALTHDLFRTFARNGTFLCPTLVTDRSLTFVDDLFAKGDPRDRYMPAAQREWWDPKKRMLTRYRTPAYIEFRKRQFAATLRLLPVAWRDGVKLLAGTDSTLPFVYPGFSLHDELALFVQAGLTPLEALKTATVNAASALGLAADTGAVEPGKRADLVLLDANPLDRIENVDRIFAVVRHGSVVGRSALDELLRAAEQSAQAP